MSDTSRNAPDAKQADAKQHQADEKHLADERKHAGERRAKAHEADEKRRAEEYKEREKRIEEAQKYLDARSKEDARRAALSPPDRVAEDEKRAHMTPEERQKDDEGKGLLTPEQFDQINLLAGTPSFPVLTETAHTAEFILSEANGQLSRDAAYLADPITIKVGQPLKLTAPATSSLPATYVPAAVGADCTALAIYAGTSNPTNGLRIAVLARNAEVNGKLINWGAIITAEQALGIVNLATKGIIVR